MTSYDNTTYHIYLKDNCVYWNLNEDDFEEKWQMLKVMIDLISKDYTEEDFCLLYTSPSPRD